MIEERNPTRTKLDFLYQEVLGEVAGLTTRIEQVTAAQATTTTQLLEASAQATAMVNACTNLPIALDKQLQATMEHTGRLLNTEAAKATATTVAEIQKPLRSLAESSARYAHIAHLSVRKMALIAVVVGAAAGCVGGLLAGIALGRYWGY
ncbi:hypothetical protein [uncultured Cedecea sp.]|uniref:hypothetical protein n=1 Tax=uncultured Cedecea sp. TaxID=988762 RepID=UPI00263864D9|nr:hypothetical protein [uncultured Cedecea sp.]